MMTTGVWGSTRYRDSPRSQQLFRLTVRCLLNAMLLPLALLYLHVTSAPATTIPARLRTEPKPELAEVGMQMLLRTCVGNSIPLRCPKPFEHCKHLENLFEKIHMKFQVIPCCPEHARAAHSLRLHHGSSR